MQVTWSWWQRVRIVYVIKISKMEIGVGSQGLKMNTWKTKVMFSCSMKDKVEEKCKWPCGVCKNGVGNNSILCQSCKKWVHKWYSGVKGSLLNASQSFICRCCKIDRPITDGLILICIYILVMGYRWKSYWWINSVTYEICWMQMEDVIQQ